MCLIITLVNKIVLYNCVLYLQCILGVLISRFPTLAQFNINPQGLISQDAFNGRLPYQQGAITGGLLVNQNAEFSSLPGFQKRPLANQLCTKAIVGRNQFENIAIKARRAKTKKQKRIFTKRMNQLYNDYIRGINFC